MNSTGSENKNKIKRRNFFYYIGAAALGTVVFTKFPFNLLKRTSLESSGRNSSIKVTENPFAVKRTVLPGTPGKGPVNG